MWLTFYFYCIGRKKPSAAWAGAGQWGGVGRSAAGASSPSALLALHWVQRSLQLPWESWGRAGRTQGRRQNQGTVTTTLSLSRKHVRTGRQGQAEANLPRVVLFPGSGPCLNHRLWDAKHASAWGDVVGRPSVWPFLP